MYVSSFCKLMRINVFIFSQHLQLDLSKINLLLKINENNNKLKSMRVNIS